ncbi:MAG: hypothetical protein AABZ31_10870, partial [Bdellovibrionota bacterium]
KFNYFFIFLIVSSITIALNVTAQDCTTIDHEADSTSVAMNCIGMTPSVTISWTSSYNNCMAAYKKEAVDKKLPAADNKELCECVTDEFFLKKDCETINELFKHMTAANAFDAKTAMTSAFSGPIGICKARIRDRIRATSHKAAVKAQAEAGIVPDPPPQKK